MNEKQTHDALLKLGHSESMVNIYIQNEKDTRKRRGLKTQLDTFEFLRTMEL